VEEGLASLDRGERIPVEEARKRIPNGFQSIPLRRSVKRFGARRRLHCAS
jgi:hypothetical protein